MTNLNSMTLYFFLRRKISKIITIEEQKKNHSSMKNKQHKKYTFTCRGQTVHMNTPTQYDCYMTAKSIVTKIYKTIISFERTLLFLYSSCLIFFYVSTTSGRYVTRERERCKLCSKDYVDSPSVCFFPPLYHHIVLRLSSLL